MVSKINDGKDGSKMEKMDQRWTKSQKMSKINRLKDHHGIGHIYAHIHAHKRIIEYNTNVKILIMRLVN